jgi:predicted nucleic acid-binding Zn ribbon protein|tara:strand:+ start:90 stop:299 length:210 start_codon:yes stop_codon:yes gene_type:complete
MLFKYIEEVMPLPNHCTDCDKPIVKLDTSNLCDECYDTLSEESKSTADEFNDYGEMSDGTKYKDVLDHS